MHEAMHNLALRFIIAQLPEKRKIGCDIYMQPVRFSIFIAFTMLLTNIICRPSSVWRRRSDADMFIAMAPVLVGLCYDYRPGCMNHQQIGRGNKQIRIRSS